MCGRQEDKVLSDALYRVNKEAKVLRDAMKFIRGSQDDDDYRNYMAAIGNRLTPHVDIFGRVVDEYGSTVDEIRDEIDDLENEVKKFEDDPEYKGDIYEDVDEVKRDIDKLEDTLRALREEEDYLKGRNPRIIKELRDKQKELYRLKDEVIDKLIEMDPNSSIDEVHRFAGSGRRLRIYERGEDSPGSHYSPLYRFGNHSFHNGTIEWDNIPEQFDKGNIKSLGTISSENELGYDLPLEQAVNTLNEFLQDGGMLRKTQFSDNPRKLVDAILADKPIVSDGRLLNMPPEEQRKEAWRICDGLRNETVRTLDGRVVHFYRRGFDETRYHSADSHTLAIIPILKEVIANAHLFYNGDRSESDREGKAYHLYARKVNLGDGDRIARIVIREDNRGNMYYDSESTSVETLKEILDRGYLKPNQAGGRKSPYAEHSLAELFSQVNQNPAGGEENLRGSIKVQKKYATEDLVVAVIANERRKGKAYGVEKIKADLASLNLDPGNAEEVSRRSDEVL